MGSSKTTKANSIMKFSKKFDTEEGLEIVPDLSHSSDSGSDETCAAGAGHDNTIIRTSSSKRDHDVEPISISFSGESTVEPVTGIEYPASLNEFTYLLGCGVRTKYLFFHAYTVGVYVDVQPSILINIKTDDDVDKLLLNPDIPRVFRLVMNRNVTSSQYIGATFEALLPLMRGKELDKLEEMKTQEMPDILPNRTEIYLFVSGDTLFMQLNNERAGKIRSSVLTEAICENYLGPKPVSPALKKAVMNEMQKLQNKNKTTGC